MSGLFALLILVLDFIAIFDILKSSMGTDRKALWIVLVLVLPVIGMALYFILVQKKWLSRAF
jgi:hypothetical protein